MNEISTLALPQEVWEIIGHQVIDVSSKEALQSNIENYIAVFFSQFVAHLKDAERKAFLTSSSQNLLSYALRSRKVAFLDLTFRSLDQIAELLEKHKVHLGTVEFKVPLFSLKEIEELSKKAGLTKISLNGNIDLETDFKQITLLPPLERLKIKNYIENENQIAILEKSGASLLSIKILRGSTLTLKKIQSLGIESLTFYQIDFDEECSIAFPKLRKLTFRDECDVFQKGSFRDSNIEKLTFPERLFSKIPRDKFFEELKAYKKLSSLKLHDAWEFEEADFFKLPTALNKLTLESKYDLVSNASLYFNLTTRLKVLDISRCHLKLSDIKLLKHTLKTLIINGKYYPNVDLEEFFPHMNLKHLTLLKLDYATLTFFKKLKTQKNLRSLKLVKSNDIDLEKLASFVKEISLKHLSLKKSNFTIDSFDFEEFFSKGPCFSVCFESISLRSLNISKTTISIKELITLSFLKKLTIDHSPLLFDTYNCHVAKYHVDQPENQAVLKKVRGLKIVKQNGKIQKI